jgi:nicotinamide riboside kinase
MYKIAVIGPESTGKSALTKALARHYSSPYVDEYARDYVAKLNRPYTFDDLCEIAKVQIEAETFFQTLSDSAAGAPFPACLHHTVFFPEHIDLGQKQQPSSPGNAPAILHPDQLRESHFVFFDTELIITKVWFEYCYQRVPENVIQQLGQGFFDLYLLCDTDLPWIPDPVREHGSDREYFSAWYRREAEQLDKPYVIVQGSGNMRLTNSVEAIDSWLKSAKLKNTQASVNE